MKDAVIGRMKIDNYLLSLMYETGGTLIDATYGRRTRAVLIMDSDHVILSAVQPETVANRLGDDTEEDDDEQE